MKKQQPIHGALRAKTRAFLCAITLAMFTSATAFAQEIYRNEGTGVNNCAVSCGFGGITLTVTPVDASKQYVQLKGEAVSDKIWITLVVNGSLSISTIDDIPLGRYVIGNTDAVGTARRSHGLTANSDDADIIGTGGLNTASSPCWFNTTEGYVIVGEDYTDAPHHIIFFASTAYHNAAQNSAQCYLMCTYDGSARYYLRTTNPTNCGSGTAAKSTWGRVGRSVIVTATPTAPATFVEWRDGDGNLISADNPHTFDGWGPNEVVAIFSDGVGCPSAAPATPTYTITWVDGNGTEIYHETVEEGDVPAFDDRTTPTKTQTAQYTYTFNNTWSPTPYAADKDQTYTAQFNQTTRQYTITVTSAGHGTVTGGGTYDYGTSVPLTATPDTYYTFSSWTDAGAQNHNVTVTGTATYTASFTLNTSSTLEINDNENTTYYSTILAAYNGTPMDIQLNRTFYANMWNTVCFPFALTAAQRSSSEMSAATFYTLTSVTGDAAEGLDFNVTAVTTETLSARTPYLVQVSGSNIVNPVFEGVTLAADAFTNNTTGTDVDQTKFFGTVHPTSLETGESSGFLFLGQDNSLYWPNVAHDIRAFRAYFYSGNNAVQAVHPRARIVVREQTATDIEETGAFGESGESGKSGLSGASAKKYLRNGSLVIERDGVKYNAVGQVINE